MVALWGVSFLTPTDALFALAVVLPLAALARTETRADRIRRTLRVPTPGRRALVPAVVALVALSSLVAVAAAQPVVVRAKLVHERTDVQAFIILDTSLSMSAAAGPGKPTRLQRAKTLASRIERVLPDVPVGIATMTDRVVPNLMPTADTELYQRTLGQAVAIDTPPPSLPYYTKRATTFDALATLASSHFFPSAVHRRLVILLTDGEAAKAKPILKDPSERQIEQIYVHVWRPRERIYAGHFADPHYSSDPTSGAALERLAATTGGTAFDEAELSRIERAARTDVGRATTHAHVSSYARIPLAPWFVLAGAIPLAFLFWRRNL